MPRRRRGGRGFAYPADMQRNPEGRYDSRRQPDREIVRGQVMDLGDLGGEEVEPVLATFTWFGERFRVNPDMTETTLIDLFEVASKVDVDPESLDPKQMDFAKGYVREHIHPDDFDRLWKTAKANRQGIQPLMGLCMRILGLVSERPTVPPSGSSAGRPVTSQSLPDGVSSPAAPAEPEVPGYAPWWPEGVPYNPTAVKFVERFEAEGRPDKANIIMMAQEARARAAASATPTG
jgi:hypothetical protein